MTITKAIQIRSILTRLIGLLFGSMVYSAGLNLFLVPNSIIDGGVVGISLIFEELTHISFSVWIIVLNALTIGLSLLILLLPSMIITKINPARVMHFE